MEYGVNTIFAYNNLRCLSLFFLCDIFFGSLLTFSFLMVFIDSFNRKIVSNRYFKNKKYI